VRELAGRVRLADREDALASRALDHAVEVVLQVGARAHELALRAELVGAVDDERRARGEHQRGDERRAQPGAAELEQRSDAHAREHRDQPHGGEQEARAASVAEE
jgi:polyphosphate kinase